MVEKFKTRKFFILLYPDNHEHMLALEKIKETYNHLYITHDKDLDEEGKLKKEHIHVILYTDNSRWSTGLAKDLGIEDRFIEKIENFENANEYLIHANEPEKHQYSVEDVKGSSDLLMRFKRILMNSDKSEADKSMELIEWIQSQNRKVTVAEFATKACEIGRWDIFRRSSLIFIKILEEHNEIYKKFEDNM